MKSTNSSLTLANAMMNTRSQCAGGLRDPLKLVDDVRRLNTDGAECRRCQRFNALKTRLEFERSQRRFAPPVGCLFASSLNLSSLKRVRCFRARDWRRFITVSALESAVVTFILEGERFREDDYLSTNAGHLLSGQF
ncbi:hypothetical protein [Paraburkholderia hiiakae]|uniref:hypothetical protein n=1 Tax=Paraburkholderia hiiakae TaxID=1081782 RepID=UPI001F190FE7|nr:hypothetical protein [Paraburkholderia hiiakae]